MPPGTVGTLAFCRVPWNPWAADTAFPSLRRVRRRKRCLTIHLVLSPIQTHSRGDDAFGPPALWKPVAVRRSAAGFARTSSFGTATHDLGADLHEPLPQVGPRSPRATPRSRPRPRHSCFYRRSRRNVARSRFTPEHNAQHASGNRPA
jgi:hypothetical protein